MGYRSITRELYDAMVTAYRQYPGNYSHAGRTVHCTREMSKRGWLLGWPNIAPWARPIQEVLADEQVAARSKLVEDQEKAWLEADDARRKAREDALSTRANLGQILKGVAGVTGAGIGAMMKLSPSIMSICESLAKDAAAGHLDALDPMVRMRYVERFERSVAMLNRSVRELQATIRLHFGEPTEIVAMQVEGTESLSAADMLEQIRQAAEEAREYEDIIQGRAPLPLPPASNPGGNGAGGSNGVAKA